MQKSLLTNSLFIIVIIPLVVLAFSCSTPKNTAYFQTLPRDTTLTKLVSREFEAKIQPDDILSITVTSSSAENSALYNAAMVGSETSGYLVDKRGNIQFYKLGELHVQGLTRDELKNRLLKELSPFLKDPVVNVRFVNHKITVLGDVGNPQVLPLAEEEVTLLDVIGQSGDLNPTARRDNILVIRQTERGKEFKRLNLLDNSIFTSPYFFVRPGDVVYVEPEVPKRNAQQTQQIVSYIISGASILFFIVDRVTR